MSEFSHRICAERKVRGLTEEAAADGIGISSSHLGDLENDFKTPSEEDLQKIAAGYSISVEELRSLAEKHSHRQDVVQGVDPTLLDKFLEKTAFTESKEIIKKQKEKRNGLEL